MVEKIEMTETEICQCAKRRPYHIVGVNPTEKDLANHS